MNIEYPSPVAKHCITRSGVSPQTNISPSFLARFHYNARLFHLLGKVIYDRDLAPMMAIPLTPASITAELRSFWNEMPPEFMLNESQGDETLALEQASGFATHRANLQVTIA